MSVGIEQINEQEQRQIKAFAKWRLAQGYDARTGGERDLHDYVNALISEIADLKAELYHKNILR